MTLISQILDRLESPTQRSDELVYTLQRLESAINTCENFKTRMDLVERVCKLEPELLIDSHYGLYLLYRQTIPIQEVVEESNIEMFESVSVEPVLQTRIELDIKDQPFVDVSVDTMTVGLVNDGCLYKGNLIMLTPDIPQVNELSEDELIYISSHVDDDIVIPQITQDVPYDVSRPIKDCKSNLTTDVVTPIGVVKPRVSGYSYPYLYTSHTHCLGPKSVVHHVMHTRTSRLSRISLEICLYTKWVLVLIPLRLVKTIARIVLSIVGTGWKSKRSLPV